MRRVTASSVAILAVVCTCPAARAQARAVALQYVGTTVAWATEDQNLRRSFLELDVEARRIRVRPVPEDPSRGDFEITWDQPPGLIRAGDWFTLRFGGRITATPSGADGIAIEHRSGPAQLFELAPGSRPGQYVGRNGSGDLVQGTTDVRVHPTPSLAGLAPDAMATISYVIWIAEIRYNYRPVFDTQPGPTPTAAPGSGGGGSTMEPGMNRAGGDYRDFVPSAQSPEICRDACLQDPRCVAWTYSAPGAWDPNPHCWLKETVPVADTNSNCTSGVVNRRGGATPTPISGDSLAMEPGMNRYGSDYRDFVPNAPRPEICRDACAQDPRCLAYTYVRPGTGGDPNPHCWLKDRVPPATPDPSCVSGARPGGAGPAVEMTMEVDVNYYGSDYRDFVPNAPRPEICRDACAQDARCLAYTYLKPETFWGGPDPHCYLKDRVPERSQDTNCVSGVKRDTSKLQR